MDWRTKYEVIEELGRGGQGRVYRVRKALSAETLSGVRTLLMEATANVATENTPRTVKRLMDVLATRLPDAMKDSNALKELHRPEDGRDSERAEERIRREIKAQRDLSHPSICPILEVDSDSKWFVMPYFSRGPLSKNLELLPRDVPQVLRLFRKIVSGVEAIHRNGKVHRDIKPDNIFLDESGNSVLGDFGIVFFEDDKGTRLSGTLENVGSRDWMPGWAYSQRIEDIGKSFDVFSLGKVLWSMISQKKVLPLWYFRKGEYNLEKVFPEDPRMKMVNRLLGKMIVEEEKDCLKDVGEVLTELDTLIEEVDGGVAISGDQLIGKCTVCHRGDYKRATDDSNREDSTYLGFTAKEGHGYRVFVCNHCGHVILFHRSEIH